MSEAEENYLKAIYRLQDEVSSNGKELGLRLGAKPASVTEMLRKLSAKDWVVYEPYKSITLTTEGLRLATQIVRRHRLWEVFLVEKLGFAWNEIHEIAEQLEHIRHEGLVERLDAFLDHPTVDPHGDFIPNNRGVAESDQLIALYHAPVGGRKKLCRVADDQDSFLLYLNRIGLALGTVLTIQNKNAFDGTIEAEWLGKVHTLSEKTSKLLFVEPA